MSATSEMASHIYSGGMPEEQAKIDAVLSAPVAEPKLLIWRYAEPAVIMGRSQRPDNEMLQRAAARNIPVQQRGSGGGAVLAGPWMLSVTLFLPTAHPAADLGIIDIFKWFEAAWLKILQDQGIPCQSVDEPMIAESKITARAQGVEWACYAGLSHGELVSADGRKLLGLAQIRKRNGVALVSGLHLSPCEWPLLAEVVADASSLGAVLARLNSDCDSLSGKNADTLLYPLVDDLIRTLNEACGHLDVL
ncbi:lipoate--protein ligase family protein [Aliamphritea hakodatensis]|uniref:lipoate--protein ligase family protein n=1 Tax=Aliamphritea hakodatensis TaxID=2895352 RepID=UPI0022FDA32E|nr:hypothetical protein [Aliamphritea hakodatensis]